MAGSPRQPDPQDDYRGLQAQLQALHRLVWHVIKKYERYDPALERHDLYQEAVIAVINAGERWDARRGKMKFESFVVWHIQNRMDALFRRHMLVELRDKRTRELVAMLNPYELRRLRQMGKIQQYDWSFRYRITRLDTNNHE